MINELRLGNWIYFVSVVMDEQYRVLKPGENPYVRKNPVRVQVSTFDKIEKSPENFAPIPLSPSILLACGFTPLSDPEFTHHHPELNILFDGEFFWLKEGSITHYLSKCEYLHKLQNGVFWVTGKELIVNIEKVKV